MSGRKFNIKQFFLFLTLPFYFLSLFSCRQVDLFERTSNIPGHAWTSGFAPSFRFTIKDTTHRYQVFLTLRHTDKYNYNNIWLNIAVKSPESNSLKNMRVNAQLGSDATGWLGTGMDDIYDHRILITKEMVENGIGLNRPGDYIFTVTQIMREDPLQHVLNVGLRIEKK